MIGGTTTQNINVPSIVTGSGVALAANPARISWGIQNVGTTPIYVLLGAGASPTKYHKVIKGGAFDSDGFGGSLDYDGPTIYNGVITVDGPAPKYVVYEIAP